MVRAPRSPPACWNPRSLSASLPRPTAPGGADQAEGAPAAAGNDAAAGTAVIRSSMMYWTSPGYAT